MKENNNGNDTNVGSIENSIEEDIKILEELLDEGFEAMCYEEAQAIRNILSDYKRVQEEFKQVDHECSRLEQKEVEMEKIIDLMLDEITNGIVNTCPLEDYNYDLDCKNRCNDNYRECWKEYFENKAKELLNK